jgi:hypothetical protein
VLRIILAIVFGIPKTPGQLKRKRFTLGFPTGEKLKIFDD